MSTSWTAIENAIQSAIVAGSGLAASHVIWETPNAGRPAGTFITLHLGQMLSRGVDEVIGSDTPGGGTPGATDYTQTVVSHREFSVVVQCFAPVTAGTHVAPPYGDNSPRSILSRVQASLALPSAMDTLAAAGCSCFDPGSVDYIPALVGVAFEGRAKLELRFNALENATAPTTYIATVSPIGATWNH